LGIYGTRTENAQSFADPGPIYLLHPSSMPYASEKALILGVCGLFDVWLMEEINVGIGWENSRFT